MHLPSVPREENGMSLNLHGYQGRKNDSVTYLYDKKTLSTELQFIPQAGFQLVHIKFN